MTGANDVQLTMSWERAPGVATPELAATWGSLDVRVLGNSVTLVEDTRTGTIRRSLHTSAYPLAEWIASRWWPLTSHLRPSAAPSAAWTWSRLSTEPWLWSHNFRAAGNGMAWPDLTVVPEGDVAQLVWRAGPGTADQPVTFLSGGSAVLPMDAVRRSLAGFVEAVLLRLKEAGISGTVLQQEWQALGELDADEREFADAASRLGLDPFDVDPSTARDIERVAQGLEPDLLTELWDSVDPTQLTQARDWFDRAQETASFHARPRLDVPLEWLRSHRSSQSAQP